MENVKVYRLNEYDGVAAVSLEQAKEYYLKMTGLSEEDAFDDYVPTEVPLDFKINEDETKQHKQTLKSIVDEFWEGSPFLAFSSD